MTKLKHRGVQDVLIAVVDGLKGYPAAITAAFPQAAVQTCIVHPLADSALPKAMSREAGASFPEPLRLEGPHGRRRRSARDLRGRDRRNRPQLNAMRSRQNGLGNMRQSIARQCMFTCPRGAPAWRRAWQEVIPFFAFDPAIRKIIYTTNAIESLNRGIRKSSKTRGSFPADDAATKLIYLAIRNFEKDGRNVREWFAARNQFAIMLEERFNA
jgi:putative transposase